MTRAEHILTMIREDGLTVPGTILFGPGCAAELPDRVRALAPGSGLLLLHGPSAAASGLSERMHRVLTQAGHPVAVHAGPGGEPTVQSVDQAAAVARDLQPGLVIGLGGGSVIDTAKAVAALVCNEGSVEDYLEGVGAGRRLEHPPRPCIAVPTTAGTGAEMTKNAVVADGKRRFKKSMRDDRMIPDAALVDPDLMVSVPPAATAAGGMDAVTQLIEPCISSHRRPEVTRLAHEALPGCRKALLTLHRQPRHRPSREQVALASMTSGACLANAGLGLAHGIASGMGAVCPVAHGLICGVLLPHVLRWNREACEPELAAALAAFLGDPPPAFDTIDRGIAALESLNRELELPPDFKYLGLDRATVAFIAENSQGSSMLKNPRPMDTDSTLAFLTPLM